MSTEAELVRHDGWAELVMNRPERKNAINGPLGVAMAQALAEAQEDTAIQALVLRGAGGAFCSGLDLKEFNAEPPPDWLADFQHIWRGVHRALYDCRVPIIGALERYAINGGAALALACDLLVVGDNAFLQVGEVQLGMAAPYNLAWLTLRHPEPVAARLALIGERHSGPELAGLGVATRCTADGEVVDAARSLAMQLAAYPNDATSTIKAGIRARLDSDADAWFDRFTRLQPAGAPKPGRIAAG